MNSRRQHAGVDEIQAALDAGLSLRLVLMDKNCEDAKVLAVAERLSERGVELRRSSANDLIRMSVARPPAPILALSGPDPAVAPEEWLARSGPAWLLTGVRFPGNAGFAIRTAEVSGASGIFVDGSFEGKERRKTLRASMYADRYMPVEFGPAETAVALATSAGRRILAIEDTGVVTPWEVDLTGPVMFIIGGEERGIPAAIQERCDDVIRLPMDGFIPSYNLQAAMASVALEALRQRGVGAKKEERGRAQ